MAATQTPSAGVDLAKVTEFVGCAWPDIQERLCEYIKIPCLSPDFDKDWVANGHMAQAMELLATWVRRQKVAGMRMQVVCDEGRTPCMLIEIAASAGVSGDPVLMYGHMDKQPPMSGWDAARGLGPFTPVVHDGRLYGRGGADDGYAVFAAVTAVAALQAQGIAHSDICILVEGSEESGSPDLPHYMERFAAQVGAPRLIVCLDSGTGNYDQLWYTTSLRGLAAGVLDVAVLGEAVHSGTGSGVYADSFRIVRRLLDRIEDADTGRMLLPELQCEVPRARIAEAELCAQVLGERVWKDFVRATPSVRPMADTAKELLLNGTWRSTLTYTGIDGLPPTSTAGNVLRRSTQVMLSVRLPPTVSPDVATAALSAELSRDPPYGAKVAFHAGHSGSGWNCPETLPWLGASIQRASQAIWGRPAVGMGVGGSIPFIQMLTDAFHTPAHPVQFAIVGILGPGSNAHAPNEFLHIDYTKKLISAVTGMLGDYAAALATGAA